MTILSADLGFYRSERMTDFTDGGGRQSGDLILTSQKNAIFDDVTDQDRAAGAVSIRKIFAATISANADPYLDAGVALLTQPTDPNVSVVMLSTGDFYDEREDIINKLEETISRGPRYAGWLWGQHIMGQRAILIWQRPTVPLPTVGTRLDIVSMAGTVEQHDQFVWITRVSSSSIFMSDNNGDYTVLQVVCELAEPLTANYQGMEPTRIDPSIVLTSLIYSTIYNANSIALYGIKPLTVNAAVNDYSIRISDLYTPIIPTSQQETALADANPGGDKINLVAGNAESISFTTTVHCIASSLSLFLGTSAMPGSINITVGGSTLSDDGNGDMILGGIQIGTVNYGTGVVNWTANAPDYSTQIKTITFIPAAQPITIADTAELIVTAENRGYVWIITLSPIPPPATLEIRYQVNSQWYVLHDQGSGLCTGSSSAYGAATLTFSTGTVVLTAAELPDVGSSILFSYGSAVGFTSRGGISVTPLTIRGTATHTGLTPGSFNISWPTDQSITADDAGVLSNADGIGAVDVVTGEWWLQPTVIPPMGAEFVINYQYGPTEAKFTESFTPLTPGEDGRVPLTLANSSILPHTVSVTWPITVADFAELTNVPASMVLPSTTNVPGSLTRNDDNGVIVNYSAGTLTFDPSLEIQVTKPHYVSTLIGHRSGVGWGPAPAHNYRTLLDGFIVQMEAATLNPSGTATVTYQTDVEPLTASPETITLSQIELDLTKNYAETIVPSSVRFRFGDAIYVVTAGRLYRNPSPITGAGTLAGTLDPSSGIAYITDWPSGGSNIVIVESLLTNQSGHPVDSVVFTTSVAPIRPGTLGLRATTLTGTELNKTVDSSGQLTDSDCTILVDALTGVTRAHFGALVTVNSLSDDDLASPWYNESAIITITGVDYIWKPKMVLADSIIYNAVGLTFLPPDSALLGIDAARLPVDGKGLLMNVGRLALVHNTMYHEETALSPTQVVDMGRTRLYRVVITDALGTRLDPTLYTVDRPAGTVTMSPVLDLTDYTAPYTFEHMIADEGRIVAVDISGQVTLNKQLSHAYSADISFLSTILPTGTLQARISNLFEQSVWTNVWSDVVIGNTPLAQFDDAEWPILVTNRGAYTDKILVQFSSATTFNVIGQNLGFIGIGTTTTDCSPINTLTGVAYFTIPHQGWGLGWSTGNCLRFNVIGANWPVDLVRAVQPSEPTDPSTDCIEMLLLGNVNQ